ncbi:MAG: hypothetical protein WC071_00835 [Victivallaceae bacterium]
MGKSVLRIRNTMKCSVALALLAFAGSIATGNAVETVETLKPAKKFAVIDSIHYSDKGDVSIYGMKPYTIFYGVHIWPKNLRGNETKEKIQAVPPSDEHIGSLVKNITTPKSPVIYDIEHWPLDIRKSVKTVADDDIATAGNKTVDASMDKMIHIISESRKVNPNVKYGYYACVPLREYWVPVENNPEQMKKWREANDYLKPLADSVDVICPSLYAFYDDHDGWVKYAKANIAEAKRMANGKPVYAFLWPKYHNSNKEDGKKFIEGDFWKLQLETVYNSGVDGVIIWDSPLVVNNPEDKVWDPNREWWKETVAFLARIKK